MSKMYSAFESCLVPGERILAVVEDLSFGFFWVPNVGPYGNYSTTLQGALALTTHRIIALWAESRQGWKWYHFSALNSLSERPLRSDKPSWPYQAIMMIPGGIGLVLQTRQPNAEHAKQLSSLLTEAFLRFGVRRDDESATTAIITHEEEEERRRQDAYD